MPDLPTCECVKAQPPLDKLRSIYCAARELAENDSSLPPCECAGAMSNNELLDNIYCALRIWTTNNA